MVAMGYKFRAPRTDDVREWSRIETALREGRDYGIPTVRKQKPKPQVSPQLRIALGVYGKRKSKRVAQYEDRLQAQPLAVTATLALCLS